MLAKKFGKGRLLYSDICVTLMEECRLRVFRRIFGPKRDNVTGVYRKLYNEELHDLYSSLTVLR
jgi:hypothetical protein